MDLQAKPVSRTLDFSLTSVNIVFLLLLFFLTAGTLMQDAETDIRAPRTEELPLSRLPRPLLVVDSAGNMFLDGTATTIGQLLVEAVPEATGAPLSGAPSKAAGPAEEVKALPVLHVMPDRNLSAVRFLNIVKSIRSAGVWNITLVTIRE